MGSLMEARCVGVGTRTELTVGATWRKPSYDRKKKVLSLQIGPPRVAPNWLRLSTGFRPPAVCFAK